MNQSSYLQDDEIYRFAGSLMTILVDGAETDGRYSLLLGRLPANGATPPHFHDRETEAILVLEGALVAETPGYSAVIGPGEVVTLPEGQVHRIGSSEGHETACLILCAPAGFEGLVRRAGIRVDRGAPLRRMDEFDMERLLAAAPLHGVHLTDVSALIAAPGEPYAVRDREILETLGARVEILAVCGKGDDAVVWLRAAPIPAEEQAASPHSTCFVASLAAGRVRSGPLLSSTALGLIYITDGKMLRALRAEKAVSHPSGAGGSDEILDLRLQFERAGGI